MLKKAHPRICSQSFQKTGDRSLDGHDSRMQDKNKIDGWVILLPGEMQNISNIRNIRKENICHKMLLYMIMKEKKKFVIKREQKKSCNLARPPTAAHLRTTTDFRSATATGDHSRRAMATGFDSAL